MKQKFPGAHLSTIARLLCNWTVSEATSSRAKGICKLLGLFHLTIGQYLEHQNQQQIIWKRWQVPILGDIDVCPYSSIH